MGGWSLVTLTVTVPRVPGLVSAFHRCSVISTGALGRRTCRERFVLATSRLVPWEGLRRHLLAAVRRGRSCGVA